MWDQYTAMAFVETANLILINHFGLEAGRRLLPKAICRAD
jgi:hypothetical protein